MDDYSLQLPTRPVSIGTLSPMQNLLRALVTPTNSMGYNTTTHWRGYVFARWVLSCVLALIVGVLAGAPARAADIVFRTPGASEDLSDELQSLSLSIQATTRADATAQDLLAAAQADYGRLTGVLYAEGYYSGIISILVDGREAAEIPPLANLGRVNRIAVTVNPGKRFAFAQAQVTPLAPGTEMPEGFRRGAVARADLVSDAARAGIDGWRDVGHAKADVAGQSITADHSASDLAVAIRLAPGPRLTFGNLLIGRKLNGSPSRVRPQRIREIAALPSGEVYSPEELERSAKRLRRTGAFSSVVLQESDTIGPNDTLDVTAQLNDAKRRRIGFGAELSSLEGLTLSTFWLHRNLLGGAERFRVDAEVGGIGGDSGGIDYKLSTRFERPATFTPDTSLYLMAAIAEMDEPDYRETSVELGAGVSHIFSDELTGEIGLAYRYNDITDDIGNRTIEQIAVPARLTWDKRDSTLDATKGFYIDLQADPFLALDSSTTGARVYVDARTYHSFGADNGLTFAGRAQAGTVAGASTTEVPPGQLFFSGGANTVRGQPYQSLGIDIGGGRRIGGRSFMAFSGELRADVTDKFGVVAFADTGFIGADALGQGTGRWHSGAGLGGRYATGLGPIRFDLATPLDDDAGSAFEIYIGIGQAF